MELLMDIKTWYANFTAASMKAQNKVTAAPDIKCTTSISQAISRRPHVPIPGGFPGGSPGGRSLLVTVLFTNPTNNFSQINPDC